VPEDLPHLEAQAKSVVKSNSMADNFTGKSISATTEQVGFHLLSLLASLHLDNTCQRIRRDVTKALTTLLVLKAACGWP
jgi:hypothetical protein